MKKQYHLFIGEKAEKEFLDSIIWYNDRLIGLGDDFLKEINKTISQIISSPLQFPRKKFNLREANVKKFPFVIIFEIKDKVNEIHVLSIFHANRNPALKFKK